MMNQSRSNTLWREWWNNAIKSLYHFLKLVFILSDRGDRHVAVKIVKNVDRYCEAARSEIQVLEHLNTTDPSSTL